ncbi:TLC domain-containing protein 2-like [Pungitius pungitius]|uniref:TLC domain-containing protein 2-like n=1 Tax=Pungitius pungitius TaxID=134920 RepID=UPI002E0F1E74
MAEPVLSCFNSSVTFRLFVDFSVMSLLVEIISVFLHVRRLLLLSGRRNMPGTEIKAPRPSVAYRVTSWLNLGPLLVFGVCTMAWMSRWLAAQSSRVSRYVLLMGTVDLILLSTMKMVLFYRLLRADILTSTPGTSD